MILGTVLGVNLSVSLVYTVAKGGFNGVLEVG